MNKSNQLLSEVTAFRTYAKYLPHIGRRESLEETINRNMTMHLERFPKLSKDIVKGYSRVHEMKVMPSMRAMQFSGEAVLKNHARQYNCSYSPLDDVKVFSEALFLLLSGVGFGFSVQTRHVSRLPKVQQPRESGYYRIHDSIAGWAEALNVLLEAYFFGKIRPQFDLSAIRPKGSYLVTTGARAPGPQPLEFMLNAVEEKLKLAVGRKLRPIEVHDIVCIASDAVLAGGIRRAALISLFDKDDQEMLTSKHGSWWEKHPYRARANNSAVLDRATTTREEFDHIFTMCKESGSGEPGFYWSNNLDWGANPSLRAGTRVWTKEFGMAPIETLENKTFTVKNLDGQLSEARCWLSGNNEKLVKITLEGGFTYYSTPQHEWPVVQKNGEVKKFRTDNLEAGMQFPRLKYQERISEGTLGSYKDGLTVGYFYGDGWITDRKDNGKRQYGVCVPQNVERKMRYLDLIKERFNGEGSNHKSGTIEFNSASVKTDEYFKQFGVDKKEKGLPSKIWKECSNDFIEGFIQGFLDADGHYGENDRNRVSISASYEKLIKEFQELLGFKGIYFNLTRYEYKSYKNSFKEYFKEGVRYTLRRTMSVAKSGKPVKIIKIEDFDKTEPVWDISVKDNTHCFQIAGCITGNCVEIGLRPQQFCNLTSINQTNIKDKRDFMNRVYAATLIGTLQASYTDFHYLRPSWRETTEMDALLGVSFTGIADGNGIVTNEWLREGAEFAKEINNKYAKKIGINPAARITAVKPEGTASCILGSSSGIHARHAEYYVRRIRMNKDDALATYLKSVIPALVEDDVMSASGIVVSIPQESPKNSITRHQEDALGLFGRALDYNTYWVKPGHTHGDNSHNVSVTLSVKDNEWEPLREQMWATRELYTGVALLPFDNSSYQQMPFSDCTKEEFDDMNKLVGEIDLRKVLEDKDNTERIDQLACAGGVCVVE